MKLKEKLEEFELGELKDDIIAFSPLIVVLLSIFGVIPQAYLVPVLIGTIVTVFTASFLYEAKLIAEISPLNPTHMILFFDEKHSVSFNTCFEDVTPITSGGGTHAYRLTLKYPFKNPKNGKLYRVIEVILPTTFKKVFEPCAFGKFDVKGTKIKLSYTIFVGQVTNEFEEPNGPRLVVKALTTPVMVKMNRKEIEKFVKENKDILNILKAKIYSLEHALEGEIKTRAELESVVDELKKSAGTLAVEYHEIASVYPSKIEKTPVTLGLLGIGILVVFIILLILGLIHL